MKIKDLLKYGFLLLKKTGATAEAELTTPFLDAVVLLSEALNVSKERLYVHYEDEVTDFGKERYVDFIKQRCSGIPVSYIRKKKEFYGLDFHVDERVLVPRPETEFLVYEALELIKYRVLEEGRINLNIIDVCTGSGCAAIALANEINMYKKEKRSLFNNIYISACDISLEALEVFKINSKIILGGVLPVFESDLLANADGIYDVIMSNPPYLTTGKVAEMKELGWPEPELALNGGEDGLKVIFKLIEEARKKIKDDGFLIIEADDNQMPAIKKKMEEEGFHNTELKQDLSGWNRIITGSVLARIHNFQ